MLRHFLFLNLHQESEEEVTDTEQAENWFSLTSAQRICGECFGFLCMWYPSYLHVVDIIITFRFSFFLDMFLALDKDMNGTLSKQELKEYADGSLTEIFIERGRKQSCFPVLIAKS